MAITYTVDKKNVVRFFGDDLDTPFILQDVHPESREWTDKAEATAWAEAWLAEHNAPSEPVPTE